MKSLDENKACKFLMALQEKFQMTLKTLIQFISKSERVKCIKISLKLLLVLARNYSKQQIIRTSETVRYSEHSRYWGLNYGKGELV